MKNICLFIKTTSATLTEGESTPFMDAFSSAGLAFDELRFVYKVNVDELKSQLSAFKTQYDNVVILSNRKGLPFLYQLLQGVFENKYHGLEHGESIYQDGKCSIYLAGTDENGLAYVKSVCVPFIAKKYAGRLEKIVLRSVGANEEHVERLLVAAKSISGAQLAYTHQRRYDEDVIQMLYNANTPKMLADDVLRLFADGLNDSLYAVEDVKLEEQLVRLLKLRGKKISIAESFTGGGVGKRIVSVSGASEVYFEGLNTYNEDSKKLRLGVSEYTLKTYGAVSDQTAYEMAAGLIATGNCDISIATTGLAGPKSDRTELPVGLCYIAVGSKEKVMVYRYKFDGNREDITQKAINYALFLAYCHLKNM